MPFQISEESQKFNYHSINTPLCVKRVNIGELDDNSGRGLLIVGLIISKRESRVILRNNDLEESMCPTQSNTSIVSNFTLRDMTGETINVTAWHKSKTKAAQLDNHFHIGDVVEVSKFKVRKRNYDSIEEIKYCPWVSSCFNIIFSESGNSQITKHPDKELCNSMLNLLSMPTKKYSAEHGIPHSLPKALCNITSQYIGNHIDVIASVLHVKEVKKIPRLSNGNVSMIQGDSGECLSSNKDIQVREIVLYDIQDHRKSSCQMVLKLWDYDLIQIADNWIPGKEILLLNEVRVDLKKSSNNTIYSTSNVSTTDLYLTASSRTIIVFNPELPLATVDSHKAINVDINNNENSNKVQKCTFPNEFQESRYTISEIQLKKENDKENHGRTKYQCNSFLSDQRTKKVVTVGYLNQMVSPFFEKFCKSSSKRLHDEGVKDMLIPGPFGDQQQVFDLRTNLSNDNLVTVFGYLSNLNPTAEDAIHYKYSNNFSTGNKLMEKSYNLKADVYDGTGSINCQLSNETANNIFGAVDSFEQMTDEEKTSFRWEYLMTPVKVDLKCSFSLQSIIIVNCSKISLSEMKDKGSTISIQEKLATPNVIRNGIDNEKNIVTSSKKFKFDPTHASSPC